MAVREWEMLAASKVKVSCREKKSDKEHKHDNIFGEHIRQFFPKSNFLPS